MRTRPDSSATLGWRAIDVADIFLEAKTLSDDEFDRRFERHLIEEGLTKGGAIILPTSAPFPRKDRA